MLYIPTRTNKYGLKYLEYYPQHNVWHPGVDYNYGYGDDDRGQPVICPTWGVVEYVSPEGLNGGLGNYLVIYHPWHGVWTRYLHLETITVTVGQKVAPNQLIGTLGKTGTLSAHLHFEVLNYEGLLYVKHWGRPYGRYPTGLTKQEVAVLFRDPMTWLEESQHPHEATTEQLHRRLETARKAILRAQPARATRLRRLIRGLERLLKPKMKV